MDKDKRETVPKTALTMLESFHRSGANRFDLTITSVQGKKIRFRQSIPYDALCRDLPSLLDEGAEANQNVIVRPRGPGVQFIQLDDLNSEKVERVKPMAFLSLETSPGNYQAWVALPVGSADEDFARRLRKGVGADPSASGATRIAGSLNFKDKYAPNFPRVEIAHNIPGLIVTMEQLTGKGLVTAPETAPRVSSKPVRVSHGRPGPAARKWPDYERCVQAAPLNQDKTGPDISRADFVWCMTASDWGFSIEETAEHLMQLSTKAQDNGEKYARLTAQNAAAAVERRQAQNRA